MECPICFNNFNDDAVSKLYIERYSSYRRNHDYVKKLNRVLFGRNIDVEQESILIDALNNKINKKEVVEKLDVYSLGITIVSLLLDKFRDSLVDLFDKLKPFGELLRHMTEMDSKNRISSVEAHKMFNKLIN